jgi:hypothetical protein
MRTSVIRQRLNISAPAADEQTHPPAPSPPQFVLDLQRGAGNAAVSALLSREPATETELPRGEVREGLKKLNLLHLREIPTKVVQFALKTPQTGTFSEDDVRELSRRRAAHHLSREPEIDGEVFNLIVHTAVSHGMHDEVIALVANFYGLDTTSETLSLRFSPTLMVDSFVTFEAAGMREIAIGKSALVSAHSIKQAIVDALKEPAPALTPLSPPGRDVLSDAHAIEAAEHNERVVRDVRSVRAIQRTLGLPITEGFDQATSQALSRLQQAKAFAQDMGKIDDPTFYELVRSLASMRGEDAVVRLIVDYKRLPEDGVLDASMDPTLTAGGQPGFVIDTGRVGGATIRFEPALFTHPPESIVIEVARAYEQVRLGRTSQSAERQQFLLWKSAVLAPGMAWEDLNPFMINVAQIVKAWPELTPDDQRSFAADLADIQDMVRRHWAAGPLDEQPTWTDTFAAVQALKAP